ncbi:MAG TPA: choice-of-anchor D domain-containing protein, partial [Nevskiaceae bacterium]|nr:choice-of-anchor D domain-containing protein [Nevskiaceae bacterium]
MNRIQEAMRSTITAARPLSTALLLAAAALAPLRAHAVDAVTGRSLYNNSVGPAGSTCSNSNCHGTNPASGANKIRNGANNAAAIQRGISANSGGMGAYNGKLTATDLSNIAGFLGITAAVSPLTLSFPSTAVGTSSAGQTVTVTSTGVSALSVSSLSSNSADFVIGSTGTCKAGSSVPGFSTSTAKYSNCSVVISFAPQAAGTRSGTLTIATSDPAQPSVAIALSG